MQEVYIVSMARTPIGSFNGSLSDLTAVELGSIAIRAAIERAGIDASMVDEVFMGNVLQANNGQAPARQAALAAGVGSKTPCTTVNKVCASGMKALMFAAQAIRLGDADTVVAGGMESMTNAPYYVPQGRNGMRYGNKELVDAIVRDGLQDPYQGFMMGIAAEMCADSCHISREMQDAYAIESYKRAAKAHAEGLFKDEIVSVEIPQRRGEPIVVSDDEEYKRFNEAKVGQISPAFKKDGTVTAVNASSINDGAAALVLMSGDKVRALGLKPIAKIRSYADAAQTPENFTTTPAKAIPKALHKADIDIKNVDVFEINEAFAVVAVANNQLMELSPDKVNVLGGAVSLGHPIGVSGARIICTLISALRYKNGKIGASGICNGGGGASAMVIELL
ncbi:MAG: acetyl-CoA C-acyltransferase [Chitinophagales bacterium]|nr:acetyl-CoA C-acyltransferase [Bacteroidota bacterium]MCB9044027.1 acetyl-CoA C-acyltransferase [Chitinophagales bacterium]